MLLPARAESVRASDLRGLEHRIFQAVNRERHRQSVPELIWAEDLAAEALRHSQRMATAGFSSHTDPIRGDLVPRLNADGIRWHECAENIVVLDPGDDDPAAIALREWLHSPGHRKNLLNSIYTRAGVGVAEGRQNRLCITQDFTRP